MILGGELSDEGVNKILRPLFARVIEIEIEISFSSGRLRLAVTNDILYNRRATVNVRCATMIAQRRLP